MYSFHSLEFNNNSDESEHDSHEENYESEDKIDSDIEAALYSQIHHCENPVYEPAFSQGVENHEAENYSVGINCERKSRLYVLNEEKVPAMVISDDSEERNMPNTSSSDVEIVCETKKVTMSSCTNNVVNQKSEVQEKNVSLTHSDNAEVIVLREVNHKKDRILTKLRDSQDLGSCEGKKKKQLRSKSKKQQISSSKKAKQNSTKCSSKRKYSDSSQSEDDVFKYPRNSAEGKNISINVKTSPIPVDFTKNNDPWFLSPKDAYPDKQNSRYYNKQMRIMCNNCSERGHVSRNCKMPKKLPACYLCGDVGHEAMFCLKPACSKCLSVGHLKQQCYWQRASTEKCTICKVMGHFSEECPDKWRRYHMTTSGGPVVYGNSCKNNRIYCYNCAAMGHFGHECQKQRLNSNTFPTSPFVSQYAACANPFTACTSLKKNAKEIKNIKKLAKKKKIISKSNKRFERRSKLFASKAKRNLKAEQSPALVKQKKKKKPKKHLNKDIDTLPSDEVEGVVNTVLKRKKRKAKLLLTKASKQVEKAKKKKKKKKNSKKSQQSVTETCTVHDDKARTSKFCTSTNTSSVFRHLVPELGFSMACMRFLSGKNVINS